VSERNAPFTVPRFAKLIEQAEIEAKVPFKAHPHMLRHACILGRYKPIWAIAAFNRPFTR
jgi:integrase